LARGRGDDTGCRIAPAIWRGRIIGDGGFLAHAAGRPSSRVMLGRLDGTLEQTVTATETSYTDAKSGQVVYAYHAKLDRLRADSAYLYTAMHDDAEPEFGTFRTAPRGRARFTFTSFGDQATPTLGKRYVPPAGVTMPNPPYVNDNR